MASEKRVVLTGFMGVGKSTVARFLASLLGSVPMAIGFGAGGESRRPLGLAVVGGLIFSQLITLYLTPVVYTYMDAMKVRVHGLLSGRRKTFTPAASTGD